MTGHSEIGCKETTDKLVLQSIDGSFKRQRASSLVDACDLFTRVSCSELLRDVNDRDDSLFQIPL